MVTRRQIALPDRRVATSDRRGLARGGRREDDHTSLDCALSAVAAQLQASRPDQRPTVLVVDDFRDGREVMCEYLRFRGFLVEAATNGQEALEKATALLPDVVLLDLVLPDIAGLDVIARLKTSERTKHIKVAVLTANVLGEARKDALDAGAAIFIPKPCEITIIALQLVGLTLAQARRAPP